MSSEKLLVADDSRTVRTRVQQVLSPAGYDVIQATDGVEALEQIRRNRPFLAILDVNMPSLDGFGVCHELQALGPPWDELPIIFLTSDRSHALEMLGCELGAYIQKPLDPESLLETVRRFDPRHLVK